MSNLKINKVKKMDYASQLLNNRCLRVMTPQGYTIVNLIEIEFYKHDAQHPDPYVHCQPDQKEYGKWYFHKTSLGNYRNGTFKGLDLVLGNANQFFGVLLRTVKIGNNYVEGPCNVVHAIMKLVGIEDIKQLATQCPDTHHGLILLDQCVDQKIPCLSGPRYGLSDKYPDWKLVNYRYVLQCGYRVKLFKTLS